MQKVSIGLTVAETALSFTTIVTAILVQLFTWLPLHAQETSDELNIGEMVMPLKQKSIFRDKKYFNWGASMIKGEDEKYHLFYSRWSRALTFSGWLTHSEIAHAVSENATGPWTYVETVLAGTRNGGWDEITAHNPKIKFFDGNYYLYYIATNLEGKDYSEKDLVETHGKSLADPLRRTLRENQRTGVAVSKSLYGPWTRQERPIVDPAGPIATLTVNPAVDRGPQDLYYLIIKGDKPNEDDFVRNQAISISTSPTGPFEIQPKPVIDDLDTEDVSLWYNEDLQRFYAVFHAHTFIGLMTSLDGINWQRAKYYEITGKQIQMTNGKYLYPERMERPFMLKMEIPKF